jgi:hydrogenase expression/formation protein HypC
VIGRVGARDAAARRRSVTDRTEPVACVDSHCITCGDEAVALRVIRVDQQRELALCENADGERTTVEIALVQPVAPGEVLLVHAGTALTRAAA